MRRASLILLVALVGCKHESPPIQPLTFDMTMGSKTVDLDDVDRTIIVVNCKLEAEWTFGSKGHYHDAYDYRCDDKQRIVISFPERQ